MDGYELARRLRERPPLAHARFIALTGYGQETDRRRSTEAGFDHHLTKPVDPPLLKELLARREPPARASMPGLQGQRRASRLQEKGLA